MKVHLAESNAWSDGNEYIMSTASEVHTNALFDIFPNDTTITAEFKGNTQQNGTPAPSAPVPVVGVGYLDGTAYKIPVEIGLSSQSIDLSTVASIRLIKKIVLTGNESGAWNKNSIIPNGNAYYNPSIFTGYKSNVGVGYCTHYPTATNLSDTIGVYFGSSINFITDFSEDIDTVDKWKNYLAAQYAANTPITVYYILSDPVIDTINEPLQKIGDYADIISNITLTTTAGAKSFGVDTAVKPSEITLNFRGWHPKDPKESSGGEWS